MKKIALLLLTVITISCGNDRHELTSADMQGQWKTLQGKASRKTPLRDVEPCEGGKFKGEIYTLNADGSFSTKEICSGKPPEDTQKNRWKYEDHILTMEHTYKGSDTKNVYSVSDMGDGKVKWKLLYSRYNYEYNLEDTGYYLVMKKQ
ncbi:hypothetical protein R1T16_05805 [Flavobacterium sp. DG1-102-2]|uniref:hypothetical protein n=1 Tax=Flavobacterium sp. DG1-102-2 TaxID=3081663 RepID=UPI002948D51E|nr:hypothetical protein [Flavobacterium sp. DG1-102-2]MDV6167930.1 hypothetical protein [Flavobacterium sp. DG1-102-2]